jgi:hypothetical protein
MRLGKPEKRKYFELIKDFRDRDPKSLAQEELNFKGVKLYIARLNDSYRVKYTLYPEENIIAILSIGRHRNVGLKE